MIQVRTSKNTLRYIEVQEIREIISTEGEHPKLRLVSGEIVQLLPKENDGPQI